MSVALITGASSGIGATFARTLARRGYDLILVARRRERLEQLARELETRAEALVADLTRDEDLRQVEQRIRAQPALDLLINNAGFGTRGRFWEAELEPQERMHRLHILATLRLTHAALAGMVARGRGAVVNVSSVAGFTPNAGNTSYASTKSWMNAFSEGLYLELRRAGSPVRVQALCPGFTWSEFHDTAGLDRRVVPPGWWMKAEDVVEASLRGLDQGKLFVIPGWKYRGIVRLVGWLPRGLYHWGSLWYARRSRREERPA